MSESDNLESRVRSWLNKTGYPLEMRIRRLLAEADVANDIFTNSYYVDPEIGEHREVDIIMSWSARYSQIYYHVTAVIECKSTHDPWVIFSHETQPSDTLDLVLFDPTQAYISSTTDDSEEPSFFAAVDLEGFLIDTIEAGEPWGAGGYTVVTAFKEKNKLDPADSAVKQVLSAAKNIGLPDRDIEDWSGTSRSIPVIVTTSPLYEAFLDGDGNLQMKSVSRSVVFSPVPGAENQRTARVLIYNEVALPELVEACRSLDRAMTSLEAIPDGETTWDGLHKPQNDA